MEGNKVSSELMVEYAVILFKSKAKYRTDT